jgi:2-amino-4-hydroxy-6-hydroxymethyldihydropteridine diphosphokinase
LLYGARQIDEPGLQVPHPRAHQRRFVLEPLVEIAPDCVIPGRGRAADLLAGCEGQPVRRLEGD